jgi:hypothetical protein
MLDARWRTIRTSDGVGIDAVPIERIITCTPDGEHRGGTPAVKVGIRIKQKWL